MNSQASDDIKLLFIEEELSQLVKNYVMRCPMPLPNRN